MSNAGHLSEAEMFQRLVGLGARLVRPLGISRIRNKGATGDSYVLRKATLNDVAAMAATLADAAGAGHFIPQPPGQWEADLRALVAGHHRPGTSAPTQTFALEHCGALVGFSIVAPVPKDLTEAFGPMLELWMSAILPKYRRRGHGRVLSERVVAALPQDVTLFARCLPASSLRQAMLVRRGFQCLHCDRTGTSWLFRGTGQRLAQIRAVCAEM